MATLKAYVRNLWGAEKTIYSKLSGGTQDLRTAPYPIRLVVITMNVMISLVIKALTDASILTDVALNTSLNAATAATYPVQPEIVPPEDEDRGTHPVDPDVGV